MSAIAKVVVIGLGQMGAPMAINLQQAGYEVIGADLDEGACARFREAGGTATLEIAEACRCANFVLTVLPDGRVVSDVLGSVAPALPSGALIVEMSSSAPRDTSSLRHNLPPRIRLIDAPVSGGVKRAKEGELTIMVGGANVDVQRARPLLDVMARKVIHCGPLASGHAMKAINNFVSASGFLAAVEALHLGDQFGIAGEVMIDALNNSSGQNNATSVKMKQFVLSRTYDSGFAVGLMAKDVTIAAELSRQVGTNLELLREIEATWRAAAEVLGHDADHTRIDEFVADRSRAMAQSES